MKKKKKEGQSAEIKEEEQKDEEKKEEEKKEESTPEINEEEERRKKLMKIIPGMNAAGMPHMMGMMGMPHMMGMPRMIGMPRGSAPDINLQGLKNPSEQKSITANSEETEARKERTQKALQKIRSKNYEPKSQAPSAAKRVSQPNIFNNPKFAMLAQMMGNKIIGGPMPKKEKPEEVIIETQKEKPDEIIMNKPTINKNINKKKPKKIKFVEEIVEEVAKEEEEVEEDKKEIVKENEEK